VKQGQRSNADVEDPTAEIRSVPPGGSGWLRSQGIHLKSLCATPRRTLLLCGEKDAANTHHRDTEYAEVA